MDQPEKYREENKLGRSSDEVEHAQEPLGPGDL